MAVALTHFEGLCGFRPVEEIIGFLKCESHIWQTVHYQCFIVHVFKMYSAAQLRDFLHFKMTEVEINDTQ